MNVSGAGSSHMVSGKKKKGENGDVVDLVVSTKVQKKWMWYILK